MDAEAKYLRRKNVALREFPDIVVSACIVTGPLSIPKSLRIFLVDDSFVEIWIGGEKYSYHWQRDDGSLYRHDNAPHKKHKHISTFPKHFHDGSENNVKESTIDNQPDKALRELLTFVKSKLA